MTGRRYNGLGDVRTRDFRRDVDRRRRYVNGKHLTISIDGIREVTLNAKLGFALPVHSARRR